MNLRRSQSSLCRASALVAVALVSAGLSVAIPPTASAGPVDNMDQLATGFAELETRNMTASGERLFFVADDGVHGDELWFSDGSEQGTHLVRDLKAGGDANPEFLTDVDGQMFFTADDGLGARGLWVSDGTEDGTRILARGLNAEHLANVGGTLFFSGLDASGGRELWRSDGTPAGTVGVRDIRGGLGGSFPQNLTDVGGTLFFTADDGVNGRELWSSDGTSSGTRLVADIEEGPGHSNAAKLTDAAGRLFFTAERSDTGRELWVSDGTPGGTRLVADATPGAAGAHMQDLTPVGDTVFFVRQDATYGLELWASDGTASGTRLVRDVLPGPRGSLPLNLTVVDGIVYFTAAEDADDTRTTLWRSDGTMAGTDPVRGFYRSGQQGTGHWNVSGLMVVAGHLHFSACDDTDGCGLWTSDGTAAGSRHLGLPRIGGYPTPAGTRLFIVALALEEDQLWVARDTLPPDTTIVQGPGDGRAVLRNSAVWSFTGTARDTASYECSLDGARFRSCSSPVRHTGLRNGQHELRVRAIDPAGNIDPTPATRSFLVAVNAFKAGKRARTLANQGKLKVTLRLPGPGVVKLRGKRAPLRKVTKQVTKAGKVVLAITPTARGYALLRKSRAGRQGPGLLPVTVKVSYRPVGGRTKSILRRYTVKLR